MRTTLAKRRATTILFATLVLAVLLAVPSSALAEKTVGLSTGSFKFSVGAGDTAKGKVFVTNDGDEDIKVLVYVSDQSVDEAGNITYTTPSRGDLTALDQPSSWSQIKMPANSKSLGNVPYLELKPKQRVPVDFSFTVPPNIPPGDHNALIFFEMFELPTAGEGTQMQVSGRIGARVTLRVKGEIVESLDVRPFEVPAFVIGAEVPYRYLVNNGGNVDVRVNGSAALLDRSESSVATQQPVPAQLVFAGESLEASGVLVAERGPIGPHTVEIRVVPVDEDGKVLNQGAGAITESRSVWLVPMWLVIAVGAVVALLIARIVWWQAVKAAGRRQARDARGRASRRPARRAGARAGRRERRTHEAEDGTPADWADADSDRDEPVE